MRTLFVGLCVASLLAPDARAALVETLAPEVLPTAPAALPAFAAPAAAGALAAPFAVASLSAAAAEPGSAAPAAARPQAASPDASPEAARAAAGHIFDGDSARPAAAADFIAPPSQEKPRLNLPVKTFVLPNGLTVVVHTDRTNPIVAVSITYKVGSQNETPGLSGFAHLFEHLMAQGTKSMKPREISRIIESNGGVRNAYTMRTNTTYHSVVPKSALKTVLWAEAERMSTLNVDERALALEQQVVLEEMRLRYLNAPYAQARDAGMAEAAFSKWENRHTTIGEAADVRHARLDDVRAFYRAHYAPNNAVLSLAGDVTESEARALAERFFGPLEARPIAPAPDLSEAPLTGETRRVIEDKFAQVPLLMAGWRAPARGTRDYWALTVLAEALGAEDESPLYQALVKEERLALGVTPNYPWWTSHSNPGGPDLFGLMMPLKTGASADAALAVVDRVLTRIATEGLDENALTAAKASLERSWLTGAEETIDKAKLLGSYAALVGDPKNLPRDFEDLLSVSAADVRAAVARWISGRGRAIVEARPAPGLPPAPKEPEAVIPEERPRAPGDPRPEIDPQPAAPAPRLERFTLSNGLNVVFVRDPRLPLLETRLSIPGGRAAERMGEEGLSAAVAELMAKGAGALDARAVSSRLSSLGWTLSTSRLMEHENVEASGLSRNSAEFFRALGELLTGASYPEGEVALWKENKADELKIQRAKPDFMSGERVKAELFSGHPYGRPALSDAELAAVDREKIRAFHRRALSPRGATLVITGDADPADLRAQLESALAGWTAPAADAAVPPVPERAPAPLSLVDRPGSKQASLTVAQSVPIGPGHPDWPAFQVMNQILGGSATSRLFVNLRVKRGFTYGAYSRAQTLGRATLWTASAEVRNEVAAPALTEMRAEIARLRDEDVSPGTLAEVKRYLAGVFLLKNESIGYQADQIAAYERAGLPAQDEIASYLRRLDALTPADIRRAARLYLDPSKMATVVVGDERALRPVLAP
ncbi:MAG: insulinase family protein [Elusimicrobia bacterium]|nr:insulinase family protein [Elusimicrobiota bacterium]